MNFAFTYDGVCDVQQNFETYFNLLTNKCLSLFKWEGLPDTVDERFLMLQLILKGKVCFFKDDDKIYALNGNVGGEPNVYYQPQFFIVANPILGSKQVRIRQRDGSNSTEGLDGVLVGLTDTDTEFDNVPGGLFKLIYQTAGLLADNISSLNVSQINGRVAQLWVADNDAIARTAEEIIRDMYEGRPYRIITQEMVDKITVLPAAQTGQSNTLLNLIEAHQYILASFFNEIGIPSNWNMKRERVNTAETELMQGALDVNVYNMERNLKAAVEKVNELFGTSISVRFNEDLLPKTDLEEEVTTNGEEQKIEEPFTEEPTTEEPSTTEEVTEVQVEEKKSEGGDD